VKEFLYSLAGFQENSTMPGVKRPDISHVFTLRHINPSAAFRALK
jgi:hypothetical protein